MCQLRAVQGGTLEMRAVPSTQSTTERLQEIVGDLHHQKPISESHKQQIRLSPVPLHCG